MTRLSDMLTYLRSREGISQKELAAKLKMSRSAIGMYETGKREPDLETLEVFADYYNVDMNTLTGKREPATTASLPPNIMPIGKGSRIPLYGRIACGTPILAVEDLEETAWLPEGVKADFALTCCGDSMINARIFDGDIVYIRDTKVQNGDIAAVVVRDKEVTLKRFYYYPEKGRVELRAENPTVKTQEYEEDELNHIRVLGKAVSFLSAVR